MGVPLFVGPWGEPDKYRLVEARSQGGEGTVWRGSLSLEGLEVAVAVKVISSVNAGDLEVWRGRWERQAELLRSLDHPGLVSVREVFEGPAPHEGGKADLGSSTLCLVMNWVEGPTLAEWVERNPGRDVLESIRVIGALAAAVDYLHGFGGGKSPVLHRDIKPSNVILSESGPKLVDFGFARVAEAGVAMSAVFTPRYTAPEALVGVGYSAASDRFSLGATAFFAFTGHNPAVDDPMGMRDRLNRVRGLEGRVDVHDAVLAMVSLDPAARPSSVIGWAQSLAMASVVGPGTMVASRPLEPARRAGLTGVSPKVRRNVLGVVGGVVVLALLVVAAQALLSDRPETADALATTTTLIQPTSTRPPTTTTPATTTTTIDPVKNFSVPTPAAQVIPGNGAGNYANGSGCTPPGETLPDGVWFGYLLQAAVDSSGGFVVFDMGCFYEGEAAREEAAFDLEPLYGGLWYYVRNKNPLKFTPGVLGTASAYWVDSEGDHRVVPFSAWPISGSALNCPGTSCGVWLVVSGGTVIELWEQEPQVVD